MCGRSLKNSYELFEEIGRGKFGTVFRCYNPTTNKSHAVKIIHKNLLTDSTDRMCLQNESKFISYLSPHPNILQISDVFEDNESLSIVTELCQPNFTLLDRIKNHPLSELEAASMMKNLLEAVSYCHKLGIAHRDIKPENILFDSWGNLKVCDFGSAEWFGDGRNMNGIVGTPYYVAPEVLLGREYNEKVDVWSSGVIMYIMLSGFPPFYGDSSAEIFEAVIRGNLRFPTKVFKNVSPSVKDLMRNMLCRDPSRRISAEQALRHPWILNGGLSSDLA